MNTSNEHQIDYDNVGTIEAHVQAASPELSAGIDDALGLQPISIRLQKDLIDNLKALAKLNGIGYQPLMRQVLTRWVDCELKDMLRNKIAAQQGLPNTQLTRQASVGAEPELLRMAA